MIIPYILKYNFFNTFIYRPFKFIDSDAILLLRSPILKNPFGFFLKWTNDWFRSFGYHDYSL